MYKKYHTQFKSEILTIFVGESYVSSKSEILCTVLGSCISVCLFDPVNKIGGINHFMLPDNNRKETSSGIEMKDSVLVDQAMRYGMTAMEILIAGMQKNGAQRKYLQAKIFGGGNVLYNHAKASAKANTSTIGERNIAFSRAYLKSEGIEILKEDVGSDYGRKIFFHTGKNAVFVKKVDITPIAKEERTFISKLKELKRKDEDVTLF